jgi:Terminase large subunit, T4likevirus-type, N-terminal
LVGPTSPQLAWAPQPGPQTAAILCPIGDLFFGGQRGGGKTDFLLGDFATHAAKHGEHAHGILFRRSKDELDEVVKRANFIFNRLGWHYGIQARTWTVPNGATLKFRHLDDDSDTHKYQGHQYTWEGFDEVGEWPSATPLDELWACLRSAKGVPCVRRLTGNPGGVGHHWLKRRYITPAKPFQPHRWQPQPQTHPNIWVTSIFIPARLEDNKILKEADPGYEDRIAAATQGNQALWRAWRAGDWDIMAGAAFEEWNTDHHVQRFEPPSDWTDWFAGVDYGYGEKFEGDTGIVFLVGGPKGQMLCRSEMYLKKKDPYTAGYMMGEHSKRWPQLGFVSLDFPYATYGGPSIIDEFRRGLWDAAPDRKVPVIASMRGPGSRLIRKQLLHEALKYERRPDGKIPSWAGAKLRFHPDCKHTIRTISTLPVDRKNPQDVDTDAEDHLYDAMTNALYIRGTGFVDEQGSRDTAGDILPPMDLKRRRRMPRHMQALERQEWLQEQQMMQNREEGHFYTGFRYGNARPVEDDAA